MERPRDEVAPLVFSKISAAKGGVVRGIRSEIVFIFIIYSRV